MTFTAGVDDLVYRAEKLGRELGSTTGYRPDRDPRFRKQLEQLEKARRFAELRRQYESIVACERLFREEQ